jgi:hypothetical protein
MPQQFGRQIKAEVTTHDSGGDVDADIERIIVYLDEVDSRSSVEMESGAGESRAAAAIE